MFVGITILLHECTCTKSPGEKTIATLYKNHKNIDMIRLVGLHGAERFMTKWIAAEETRAGLRHAVVCPNVTERTKERIAQSKRARAGSLALVD